MQTILILWQPSQIQIFSGLESHETFYSLSLQCRVDSYRISEQTGARLSSVPSDQVQSKTNKISMAAKSWCIHFASQVNLLEVRDNRKLQLHNGMPYAKYNGNFNIGCRLYHMNAPMGISPAPLGRSFLH